MISDTLIASWLLFLGSIIYLGLTISFYARVNISSPGRKVEIALELLSCLSTFIGALSYVYVCNNNGWSKLLVSLKSFKKSETKFISRYFTHNVLLMSNWLFYLPIYVYTVFLIIAMCEFTQYGIQVDDYREPTQYYGWLTVMVLLIIVFFSFPFAVMPQLLSQNDSTGSDYIWYPWYSLACCSSCCGENKQERIETGRLFVRKYLGSDITFAYCMFSVSSTWGTVATAINLFCNIVTDANTPNYFNGLSLFSSILFMFGSWIFLYSTYPVQMIKNNYQGPCYFHYLYQCLFKSKNKHEDTPDDDIATTIKTLAISHSVLHDHGIRQTNENGTLKN